MGLLRRLTRRGLDVVQPVVDRAAAANEPGRLDDPPPDGSAAALLRM